MIAETIPQKIEYKIKDLKINDSVEKKELILEIYKKSDEFITRSFDVHLVTAKKQLQPKQFKTVKGCIIRIS
jgi:hypothetical protein